ncbi:MAG: hypothetical protein ACYTDU_02600 [Planctomycetota bacterium]|jgi:hypothetical protein
MGAQEIATFLIVAAAAVWLAVRWWRRRNGGNCCGEAECPAAKATVEKLERV